MKVYFGSSITYSRDLLPVYQKIVTLIEKMGHKVVSKYVVDPKLKIGLGLSPEKLFAKETKAVEQSEVMIAEITVPSWGTSFLMSHAVNHSVPVLALHYKGEEKAVPLMIKGHPDLYVESYNEDNIRLVLRNFLDHIQDIKKRRGKLVVFEGGDASGKTTQALLFVEYLKEKKIPVKYIEFPRYYTSFHGEVVGRYLKGEFGSLENTSSYLVALAYAIDRAGAKEEIDEFLRGGGVVVSNRYVPSSKAYFAAKFTKEREQSEFIQWVDELEYKVHKIPREDLVVYLDVPLEVSQKLLTRRGKRGYSGKTKDLHEVNLEYLSRVESIYRKMAKSPNWELISCVSDESLLPKEEVQKKVIEVMRERKIV